MGKYGQRKEKLWELQERIISLPVFRKNSLRLYCRVPMKDICYIERIEKERPQWIERLKEYQEDNERIPFITQTSHPKSGHKACINAGWDTNQLIS